MAFSIQFCAFFSTINVFLYALEIKRVPIEVFSRTQICEQASFCISVGGSVIWNYTFINYHTKRAIWLTNQWAAYF
jgi:hypothetical protein